MKKSDINAEMIADGKAPVPKLNAH